MAEGGDFQGDDKEVTTWRVRDHLLISDHGMLVLFTCEKV